ncbi:hypothetical protein [Endozoicomonas euniceicola]|uniref:Uncharacterized protein n=1 Tax=Endozoicomonas euniceicola TaxID=1234143 RepID=A0ABY6GPA8_9GAMM|nr:hypothetical protein [Endozoicomonas euniceicola]UYM14590.1 hypothetical protein NX720_17055 [Endozoicomonas euniceicola]
MSPIEFIGFLIFCAGILYLLLSMTPKQYEWFLGAWVLLGIGVVVFFTLPYSLILIVLFFVIAKYL